MAATPEGELRVQIALTAAFINTRPVDLVFTPMTTAPDGSGGKRRVPLRPPRPPQRMRFVEDATGRRVTDTGTQYVQAATLLALPTAAIAVEDEFTWNGGLWRVDELMFPNEYEIRAVVLRYGR